MFQCRCQLRLLSHLAFHEILSYCMYACARNMHIYICIYLSIFIGICSDTYMYIYIYIYTCARTRVEKTLYELCAHPCLRHLRHLDATGSHLRSSGQLDIWTSDRSLDISGRRLRQLVTSGRYLETSGRHLETVRASGNISKASKDIWRHLEGIWEASGNI